MIRKAIPKQEKKIIILCWLTEDAKPFFWRWFFGWRGVRNDGAQIFSFSKKDWKAIAEYAAMLKYY